MGVAGCSNLFLFTTVFLQKAEATPADLDYHSLRKRLYTEMWDPVQIPEYFDSKSKFCRGILS